MASPPGTWTLDGAPGPVGKCQVGSGEKDSALGGRQHLLANVRTGPLSCGQLTTLVPGRAAGGLAWTPHRALGYQQGEGSGSRRLGSDANPPTTMLPTPRPGDSLVLLGCHTMSQVVDAQGPPAEA